MKKKITFLITAAVMLLTMMASTATAWGQSTAVLNIADYADAKSWENDTRYPEATIDVVTFSASNGTNTGKYYTSGEEWRYYQTENASITISVPSNYTLTSVTPTFGVKNTGALYDGTTALTSGESVTVSGTTVTFTVGNSGTATNGQVKFTNIEVAYTSSGGSQPTTYTVTFDAGPGTFVGSTDFPNTSNTVEAGTYALPSATPVTGYDFDGWLATGSSIPVTGNYNVSSNVAFTASYSLIGGSSATIVAYDFSSTDNFLTSYPGSTHPGTGNSNNLGTFYYTNGDAFTASGTNRYFNSGYFILGKADATLQLPAFDFDVEKIEITGRSGASGSVVQNIFVGSTAVSTATTGATGTNIYVIADGYETAGTVYTLKVTSSHNTQITQIKVFEKAQTSDPSITAANVDITYNATQGSIAYTLNNASGNVSAAITSGDWLTLGTITSTEVPFTCSANTAAAARTATVTLSYTGANDKVVTITQAGNPDAPGTLNNPYTVAQALESTPASGTTDWIYVHGIVSAIVEPYNSQYGNISYNISDDGENNTVLYAFRGKSFNGDNFTSANDVLVGDVVTICGKLKTYQGTKELDAGNYLIEQTHPAVTVEAPTFSPIAGTYAESQTVTMSCTTEGAAIHYTTDGTEPDGNSTQYSEPISVSTTTTFKAKAIKGSNMSSVVTATYHINSASSPYTVAQALAFHEYPTSTIWVHGIVSTAPTQAPTNSGQLTYYISDDGTAGENNQLEVYKGLGLNGAAFTAQDDIQVGDIVTITGIVKIYSSTIEFDTNNQLTYFERPTPTVPTITVNPATVNATAAETEGTLLVTYTNITTVVADVYFCDANGNAATYDWIEAEINDDDNVDYVIGTNTGTARTAYFKVYALGDTDYVYSNLVTINQAAGSTPPTPGQYDWVLTDLEDLTADDVFVIVGDNGDYYAMENDNGTSAPSAVAVTVENNKLSGEIASDIQWNLSISDDGYMFYPNGTTETWLYCTNTNNGVKVGEGTTKFFTMDATYGYLKNIATSRYIGIYNSADWRCYSVEDPSQHQNIGGQTFAFYKRVPATPSISINPGPFDVNSNGGNAKFPIEYANLAVDPQLSMVFVAADGVTPHTYDWISAEIVNDSICGHILINEGNARTAYFKVAGYTANNDTICSNIAIVNQSAYTLSIVFQQPASIDLAAGGETDRKISFDYQGLGNNPTFEVHRYESDGTTPATYDWLTTTISGNKVKITVPANPGDARHAYFKVYGTNGTVSTESNLVTVNQAAHVETYSLVTNVNQIVSGKHYLFVGYKGEVAHAMGYDKGNNRNAVEVTVDNNTIPETVGAYEFVINNSGEDWTIYDNNVQELNTNDTYGFLYAAGGTSNNYLKTRTTNNDDKGIWTITIDDETHVASITAKSTGRNKMRFNDGNSPLFSCYSDGQKDIYLYVKDNDDNLEYYGTEITYPGTSIPDGGSITVGSGSVITVPNGFTNDSPDNILIEEGGQLIHESDVAATVQKNITAYTTKDGDGWYLIATPVETIDKSVVAGTTYDLFLYSEPDAMWYAHWDNPGFQTLNRGQGYLYANAEDKTINYAGSMKATNANINIDLDYTNTLSDAVRGFNLVGNPFTRNLVLGDMKLGGANLTTYYVTNTDRTALQAITSDAYQIKPGEGFFVQATAASQQLSFNASSKDDIDFRYIKIVAGNENGYDNAYIQMGDCNTLRKMNIANKTEVYVMDGEDDYAAARVEELAGSMPVHFKAIADGEYTITIEAKYTDVYYMHLFDNFTGEDIDLMLEPSYTFHAAAEDAENRFLLVFDFNNHLSVNENYTNDVFAYQYGDEIIINGEGELQIFDVMGRMVLNTKVNGVQSFNVPSNGVYILRIIGNDIKTQKIVVK